MTDMPLFNEGDEFNFKRQFIVTLLSSAAISGHPVTYAQALTLAERHWQEIMSGLQVVADTEPLPVAT